MMLPMTSKDQGIVMWFFQLWLMSVVVLAVVAGFAYLLLMLYERQVANSLASRRKADPVWAGKIAARLKHVKWLAKASDSMCCGIGLDPIVGLIPYVGDILSLYPAIKCILLARDMGVPRSSFFRMITNSTVDMVIGFIPVVGDIFDAAFKSNLYNVEILEEFWSKSQS